MSTDLNDAEIKYLDALFANTIKVNKFPDSFKPQEFQSIVRNAAKDALNDAEDDGKLLTTEMRKSIISKSLETTLTDPCETDSIVLGRVPGVPNIGRVDSEQEAPTTPEPAAKGAQDLKQEIFGTGEPAATPLQPMPEGQPESRMQERDTDVIERPAHPSGSFRKRMAEIKRTALNKTGATIENVRAQQDVHNALYEYARESGLDPEATTADNGFMDRLIDIMSTGHGVEENVRKGKELIREMFLKNQTKGRDTETSEGPQRASDLAKINERRRVQETATLAWRSDEGLKDELRKKHLIGYRISQRMLEQIQGMGFKQLDNKRYDELVRTTAREIAQQIMNEETSGGINTTSDEEESFEEYYRDLTGNSQIDSREKARSKIEEDAKLGRSRGQLTTAMKIVPRAPKKKVVVEREIIPKKSPSRLKKYTTIAAAGLIGFLGGLIGTRTNGLETKLRGAKAQVEKQSGNIQNLNAQYKTLEAIRDTELKEKDAAYAKLEKKADELDKDLNETTRERTKAQVNLDETEKERAKVQANLDEKTEQHETATEERDELEGALDNQRQKYGTLEEKFASTEIALEKSTSDYQKLSGNYLTLEEQTTKLESEKDKAQKELADAKKEHSGSDSTTRKALEEKEAAYNTLEKELATARVNTEAARTELTATSQRYGKLHEEYEALLKKYQIASTQQTVATTTQTKPEDPTIKPVKKPETTDPEKTYSPIEELIRKADKDPQYREQMQNAAEQYRQIIDRIKERTNSLEDIERELNK